MNASQKRRASRRGLALIEVLLCASIGAMMLTATGVAFRSSVMAYRDNSDRNMMLSEGRIAMRELISEIRMGDQHTPLDSSYPNALSDFGAGTIIKVAGIVITKKQPDNDDPAINPASNSTWVSYYWSFDSTNKTLTRSRQVGIFGTIVPTSVTQFVSGFTVQMEPARSAANVQAGNATYDILQRASVTMTMQNLDANGKMINDQGNGLAVERIVDAAVPRRNFPGI